MSEQKDAAFYLANPDQLAGLSPEALEALAYPGEATGAVQDETAQADPAPSGDAVVTKVAGEQPQPDAILARDGKHLIPITVLDSARNEASTAKATAQAETEARVAAEQRLAELQAKVDAMQVGDPKASTEVSTLSAEEIAAMEEDFPVIAKGYKAMQAEIARLQALSEAQETSHKTEEVNTAARTVQDLIDSNPKLSHLQTSDPEGWAKAIAIDDGLKSAMPDMASRFNAVVAAYEAQYGAVSTPSKVTTPPEKTPAKPNVPISMSQIPGGTPPAVSEAAALLAMNGTQAMAHFEGMTKEQIERKLDALL
jgi:hypothetical protein